MRQVSIVMRTGRVSVEDVPEPVVPDKGALVRVRRSLVSAGTERAKVDLGSQSLLGKARSRPDAVAVVADSVRRDGIRSTVDLVKTRLGTPEPLGYSCAGVVEAIGREAGPWRPGTRVACAGAGHAGHAELVAVPRNLMAAVPAGVSDEAAAYATVGAIALQGLRRSGAGLGDEVLVIGLGLVGQLTVQLAQAAGCRVAGLDPDEGKRDLAAATAGVAVGASLADLGSAAPSRGFDMALITAATSSSQPVETAAAALRDRGTVVVVGDVGLELERAVFYDKELDLRLSRSYGPGRYDPHYEEAGVDYPIGYVRWTEQRNLEAFLAACAQGAVDPTVLTTHRFPIEGAAEAYALLEDRAMPTVGIVLEYPEAATPEPAASPLRVTPPALDSPAGTLRIGLVGTGRFATRTLLPTLAGMEGVDLVAVAGARGLSAAAVAAQYEGVDAESGFDGLVARPDIDAVIIATRHDTHADLVAEALAAGKHAYVEKPLVRVEEELAPLLDAYNAADRVCMVGFNRRYAPAVTALTDHFADAHGPRQVVIRVNAGPLDGHWLTDPEVGGGRLVGEGCHFFDLALHLAGRAPQTVSATGVPNGSGGPAGWESFSASLHYEDGSQALVVYSALGDPKMPKERVEVFAGGAAAAIDDFRRVDTWRHGKHQATRSRRGDKGHAAALAAFAAACRGEASPWSFRDDVQSMVVTFAALRSLGTGAPVVVPGVE